MKKTRLLSGFLALALCAAMLCVPVSAAETSERLPGAPVRVWGTLTRTEAGKNGSFMLEETKDNEKQQTVLLINDETLCLDAVSGLPVSLDTVKDGSTAYVYTSPIMLTSYPPQTSAVLLLVNIPADFGVPSYYTVTKISTATSSGIQVTTDQGTTVTIPKTATFFPHLTKNIVTMESIRVGSRILVWSDAKNAVSKVMIFAYDPMNAFTDIKEGDAHFEGIRYVVRGNLMTGTTDSTFDPTGGMTRAAVAVALWQAAGTPEPKDTKLPFSDVKADATYAKAITWAAENGLVQGYSDGTFAPERTITREQMAVIVYRYEKLQGGGFTGEWMFLLDFTDRASISESAYEGVAWCVMNKILSGRADGTLAPKATVTRAQAATMLMRYLTLDVEAVTLPATK